MTRRSVFTRIVVGLVALGALAVLFLRSAQSAREAPFFIDRGSLTPWTLVFEPNGDPLGSWLALRPPRNMAPPLGRQVFARAGVSVHYPSPASVPLLLRSEFDRALAGILTPDAVMDVASAARIETAMFERRCMGHRRISEPGATREVYFVLFDAPAFAQFRQQIASEIRGAGGDASLFDPAALSPVLIVASTADDFSRWMPLRAVPDVDCLAPIEVQ